MTKILYIPTGTILTYRIEPFGTGGSNRRTSEYSKGIYATKGLTSEKALPVKTAEQFVYSLCNSGRHEKFKEYFKISADCVKEEFELID